MYLRFNEEGAQAVDLFSSDFLLIVDTSELQSGRLEFDIGSFVKHVQRAVESGEKVVRLGLDEAREWGLKPEDEGLHG